MDGTWGGQFYTPIKRGELFPSTEKIGVEVSYAPLTQKRGSGEPQKIQSCPKVRPGRRSGCGSLKLLCSRKVVLKQT